LACLCKLKSLFRLKIWCRLSSLPACVGELIELRHLDVQGNQLSTADAFPASLSKLTNLVELIGFEQGVSSYQGPDSNCIHEQCCVPTFETLAASQGHEEWPSGSWKCRPLTAELDALPFFAFRRLEKFWMDMNNLTLTPGFFERAATAWPSLRSLDLYDNAITVDIIHVFKLKALPQMMQLLLHGNRIYGTLRGNNFLRWPESWSKLDLSMNPRLEGCLHPDDLPPQLALKYFGTRVTVSRWWCARDTYYAGVPSPAAGGATLET